MACTEQGMGMAVGWLMYLGWPWMWERDWRVGQLQLWEHGGHGHRLAGRI